MTLAVVALLATGKLEISLELRIGTASREKTGPPSPPAPGTAPTEEHSPDDR